MSLVVGTVIGTGVFLKAGIMSQTTGAPSWVMLAWALAGLLSLTGALCYAELGGMFPSAGGEYVYLREAYGSLPAFLFGWMRFWIGTPGSIAAYGVGAATFLGGIVPLGGVGGEAMVAIALILIFTMLNCFTVTLGGRIQAVMTALKLFMLVGLTFSIFAFAHGTSWGHLAPVGNTSFRGLGTFGTAMLAALWAYDGWNNMPMAAGEIRDPERNVPRALIIGMTLVFAIYALANLAYFYALPFDEILSARSKLNPNGLAVAAKAVLSAFGPIALTILSITFVCSAIGSMNGSILTGARVPYAMARDGLFFRQLGTVTKNSRSPVTAVVVQGVISCVLALSNSFDQLTDYVIFASWIFYATVAASLFVFRIKRPELHRPYRTPFYPWLPLLFVAASLGLLINTIITSPQDCAIGLAMILAGIPVYAIFRRSKVNAEATAP